MNYRSCFKSIENIGYKVEIITDPLSHSFGEFLLSGESPVTITYTTSEKLFDPLRNSIATVSILTEDYPLDIYTGEAMGTRVDIYRDWGNQGLNYQLLWTGYLQPNIYSQDYSDPVSHLELEISDVISTCQYFDYEILGEKKEVVSFDAILKKIFERFPKIDSYFVSNGVKYKAAPNAEIGLDLQALMISEENFFSTENEPWNLKEVLEETCKYFGFTCFEDGSTVYFIDYSTYSDLGKCEGRMYRKDDQSPTKWAPVQIIEIGSSFKLSSGDYRMTGGSMSLDDVYNKVQVRDNFYELKEMVPPLLEDNMLVPYSGNMRDCLYKLIKGKNPHNVIVPADNVMYFFWKNKKWRNIHYDYIPTKRQPVDDPEIEVPLEKVLNTDAMTQYRGSNFISMSYQKVKDEGINTPAKFQKYLHISHLNGGGGSWMEDPLVTNNHPQVEITDVPPVAFGANQFLVLDMKYLITFYQNKAYIDPYATKEIKGSGDKCSYDGYNFSPTHMGWVRQVFWLRINHKWYNGEGWQDAKTGFWVDMEQLKNESYYNTETSVENGVVPEAWMSTNGRKIALPEKGGYTNDFYFAIGLPNWLAFKNNYEDFYDNTMRASWGTAHIFISDFKLLTDYNFSYFDNHGKAGLDKPDKADNIFENIINEKNILEMDPIELKITTDNGKGFSYSNVVLYTQSPEMLAELHHPKFERAMKPEENIIQRYVKEYSTPTIKENITIKRNIKQFDMVTDPFWGKKFLPLGAEIDLAMERQTINLIEKKF